jgi:hypothetical protein
MSISLYKPNSKNTGCGFSFQAGIDNKSKEISLYAKAIKQHSWDSNKKQGYFSKNSGNQDKTIIVKFNEFECGELISAIRARREYNTFHSFGEDKTVIKFGPWDKKAKKSFKDEKTGNWEEKWITLPAFSLSFTRNGNQLFGIGIEPGEAEVIMEYLKFVLNSLFKDRFSKQIKQMNAKKDNAEGESLSYTEREDAPF